MPDLVAWIRTSESAVPRGVRALRRTAARISARLTHRSLPEYLAAVIDEVPERTERRAVRPSSGRRRIVEVSTYPLHPRQSGGQLRGWHLAEALGHDGDTDVTVVSLTTDPGRVGRHELAPHLTELCLGLSPEHADRETRLRLVTGNVSITDIASGLMWNGIPEFADVLERELAGAAAAVLVQPYLVGAVQSVASGVPIVCDEHNDELILKRSIIPPNSAGRWLLDRIDETERSAVEDAVFVTATTQADLDSLGSRYSITAPTAVVPNGVDTTDIEFVTGGDRLRRRQALAHDLGLAAGRPAALFVGSGHGPNIAAGHDIIELSTTMPDVDFLLAGRHSALLPSAHLPSNVRLLGLVSDDLLDLLLAGCDIALNPMRSGSGSNLKLLTYLAAGLPVVSTAVGARGIDAAAAGVEITDDADLDRSVNALLGVDNSERSLAGRRYVEEHCDWRAIGRRFAALTADHISS